jgi:hypothetical protein
VPANAHAQLVPHARWWTIETEHFRVHYTAGLEAEARRGAANAERAWREIERELKAPRGKVDLVIADNVDYVNGYASSFPSNRIVVFAHPPVDAPELRNYDDWSRLVITHELVHIFHLDRADGLWRFGRTLLGRHPALFPNAYMPAWVIEGLAVYYESRITGAGRLEGTEHYMIARAAAESRRLPRIGELSRSTTRFPGGQVVYAYGGLIFDYLARTRGPDAVPKFVDVSSKVILPLSLNRKAKRAFGISFENAWRDWRDSLVRAARARDPLPRWRDLTLEGRNVEFPRWLGDTAILYSAATGKEVPAAYTVSLDGTVARVGRRNGLGPNVRLPDGSIIFSQPDFVDPFHWRNDLYVERDGAQRRLTHNARLSLPDVSLQGTMVAGTTRLVLLESDGTGLRALAEGSDSVQWSEPRWSPDGRQVAAVKIRRGGVSEILVLDTAGRTVSIATSERASVSTPSWSADGSQIFYASTRTGSSQIHSVPASGGGSRTLSSASTGVFHPVLSPNGELLAGLSFRFDGFHVGVAPLSATRSNPAIAERSPRQDCSICRLADTVRVSSEAEASRARRYSPWQSLAPRYWEPILGGSTGDGMTIGAATSGYDVIGRHSWYAQYDHNTKRKNGEAFGAYTYAGFGQPYLNFSASQEWEYFGVFDQSGDAVGELARRARIGGISASFVRPRARTGASFTVGADVESRTYSTDPDSLLPRLAETFSRTRRYPSVFASAGWANTKRPALSISREDGVALSASVRQRWESGELDEASRSVTAVAQAYKSLDLPGFAHHVIALRGAAGLADRRAISTFSAGGVSGGSLEILSGVSVGEGRRIFGVRGFPPSAEQGTRAFAGTVEYRAPIAAPSRRVRFIPILFDRVSTSAFIDAGRAYCPTGTGGVCGVDRGGPWMSSAGAELDLDTAFQYDYPARLRLGVAAPLSGKEETGARVISAYFTIGSSF